MTQAKQLTFLRIYLDFLLEKPIIVGPPFHQASREKKNSAFHPAIERVKDVAKNYWKM
jgi:hypothetical protein